MLTKTYYLHDIPRVNKKYYLSNNQFKIGGAWLHIRSIIDNTHVVFKWYSRKNKKWNYHIISLFEWETYQLMGILK